MTRAIPIGGGPSPGVAPAAGRAGSRLLVRAVGVVVVGGMLVAVLLPSLCRAREPANRIKCASNLRQIGMAMTLYAGRHDGLYPPSLAVLPSVEDLTADVMICPSSNDVRAAATDAAGVAAELAAAEAGSPGHTDCLSYVYAGRGLTRATATAATILAYEPLDNHAGGGTNVLFGDGRVEFVSGQAWPKLAGDAGIAVARRQKH